MSDYQVIFTEYIAKYGMDETVARAEEMLNAYLPEPAWSGHSLSFLLGMTDESSLHLRVRKDFFEAAGIDLKVKLQYPTQDFMAILLALCKDKKLEVSRILGCEWNQAPKDNYVLGILILLLAATGSKSFLMGATMDSMIRVDMANYTVAINSLSIQTTSVAVTAFNKFKKTKAPRIREGTVLPVKFLPAEHKIMIDRKASGAMNQFGKTTIKNKQNGRAAIRAAFANRQAAQQAELLGLTALLEKEKEEMLAESDVDAYSLADIDDYSNNDDFVPMADQKGLNVNFEVNTDYTAAIIKEINSMPLPELLGRAARTATTREAYQKLKIAEEVTKQNLVIKDKDRLQEALAVVEDVKSQYRTDAQGDAVLSVMTRINDREEGEGRLLDTPVNFRIKNDPAKLSFKFNEEVIPKRYTSQSVSNLKPSFARESNSEYDSFIPNDVQQAVIDAREHQKQVTADQILYDRELALRLQEEDRIKMEQARNQLENERLQLQLERDQQRLQMEHQAQEFKLERERQAQMLFNQQQEIYNAREQLEAQAAQEEARRAALDAEFSAKMANLAKENERLQDERDKLSQKKGGDSKRRITKEDRAPSRQSHAYVMSKVREANAKNERLHAEKSQSDFVINAEPQSKSMSTPTYGQSFNNLSAVNKYQSPVPKVTAKSSPVNDVLKARSQREIDKYKQKPSPMKIETPMVSPKPNKDK